MPTWQAEIPSLLRKEKYVFPVSTIFTLPLEKGLISDFYSLLPIGKIGVGMLFASLNKLLITQPGSVPAV